MGLQSRHPGTLEITVPGWRDDQQEISDPRHPKEEDSAGEEHSRKESTLEGPELQKAAQEGEGHEGVEDQAGAG